MIIVFLGAPGAGKGTHAGFVSKVLNIPLISAGNILRAAVRMGTPLGNQVKEKMESGSLVPDEITIGLMRDRLAQSDCAEGAIFDGFPRNLAQAVALDEICDIDIVLSLEVPDDIIIERMAGRLTCPKCQRSYHIISNPPRIDGICDVCGTGLEVRADDTREVIEHRFQVFHELTEPVKEYYARQGKLKIVKGQEDVEHTRDGVFAALGITQ